MHQPGSSSLLTARSNSAITVCALFRLRLVDDVVACLSCSLHPNCLMCHLCSSTSSVFDISAFNTLNLTVVARQPHPDPNYASHTAARRAAGA